MTKRYDESIINEQVKEARGIIGSVVHRYHKGNQVLVIVSGTMGSGKSYACLRCLELFYKEINEEGKKVEDWMICRSPIQFSEAMLRAKKGDQLIVEEASALYSSRRSSSTENVSLLSVLETCRKRKIGLWLNFPIQKSLDIGVRKLASHSIQMVKINKEKGFSIAAIRKIQYNENFDKIYTHALSVRDKETGLIKKITKCWFAMPDNKDLIERYENLKDEFIENHFRKQLKKLKNKESKENAEFLDISEKEQRLNKRDDKIKELYKEGLSLAQIGKKVGLTRQRISQVVNSNKKEDGKE